MTLPRETAPCRTCNKPTDRLSRICLTCSNTRRRQTHYIEDDQYVHAQLRHLSEPQRTQVEHWYNDRPILVNEIGVSWRSIRSRCTKYRLPMHRWLTMVARQEGTCAICKRELHPISLFIDHDHASGRVRGLLCAGCNTGLGQLGIDGVVATDRAEAVLAYVRTFVRQPASGHDHRRQRASSVDGTP